jgi:O-antigen/teichoic acid export membrane protein
MESPNFRQILSNFTFLSGGEIFSKICTFAAFAFLARVLGPHNFGNLELTLVIMVFFTLLVDLGSGPYGARVVAQSQNQIAVISSNIIVLRLSLSFTAYLLLQGFAFLLTSTDTPIQQLLFIYGFTLFGTPWFLQWVFQGLDKMKLVAFGSIIRQSIFAVGVFLLVRQSDQLLMVAFVDCISVGGLVLYNLYVFRSQIGRFTVGISLHSLRDCFVQAFPIGLSELLWALSWYSATVILGLFIGEREVGLFGAAHRSVMALHTFVYLYFYNMLPSVSRCVGQPMNVLQRLMRQSMATTSWCAVFLGTLGSVLAEPLLIAVYGFEYSQAVPIFQILIWVVAVMLLSGHYTYTLIAFNSQRLLLICYVSSATLSMLLSLFLIPRFGALGAATAILVSAIVNWGMTYVLVCQNIGHIPFGSLLIRPAIAGLLIIISSFLIYSVNLLFSFTFSAILYGAALSILQPEVITKIRMLFDKIRGCLANDYYTIEVKGDLGRNKISLPSEIEKKSS